MHRQYIKPGQRIIHKLTRPLKQRIESRRCVGPYTVTPPNASDKTRSFYLGSDFMPVLRWQWADEVTPQGYNLVDHKGWYCGNDQFEVLRGLVFRLPHSRGFLAAWSMGEHCTGELSTEIYDEERDAVHAADDMARYAAERWREADRKDQAEQAIEYAKETIAEIRENVHSLIVELRETQLPANLCAAIRATLRQQRLEIHGQLKVIRNSKEILE